MTADTKTPRAVRLRTGVEVTNGITGETGPTYSEYVVLSDYEKLASELARVEHLLDISLEMGNKTSKHLGRDSGESIDEAAERVVAKLARAEEVIRECEEILRWPEGYRFAAKKIAAYRESKP